MVCTLKLFDGSNPKGSTPKTPARPLFSIEGRLISLASQQRGTSLFVTQYSLAQAVADSLDMRNLNILVTDKQDRREKLSRIAKKRRNDQGE